MRPLPHKTYRKSFRHGSVSRLGWTLASTSAVSIGFFLFRALRSHTTDYWFMTWNLFLAAIPLLLMIGLIRLLERRPWSSWQGMTLSFLWLGFLPNSFYMVSDYIHLEDTASVDVLYDAVMLTSFICSGLLLGYISLYLFHTQLRRRVSAQSAHVCVASVLFVCSFAIYLGRDLRWNTWDLFINPSGILFDVSDRFINPRAHPQMFLTIASFFVLLTTLYFVCWNLVEALRRPTRD